MLADCMHAYMREIAISHLCEAGDALVARLVHHLAEFDGEALGDALDLGQTGSAREVGIAKMCGRDEGGGEWS